MRWSSVAAGLLRGKTSRDYWNRKHVWGMALSRAANVGLVCNGPNVRPAPTLGGYILRG
jgi:hypothetical protein